MGMQKFYLWIVHMGRPGANGQIFKKVAHRENA